MNDFIICPKCEAKNPINAKFCRMCNHPLSLEQDEYTPALFPDIALRPVAVLPIRFVSFIEKWTLLLIIPLFLFVFSLITNASSFKRTFGRDGYESITAISIIFFFVFVLIAIRGIKHYYRHKKYTQAVDYVEESCFAKKLRRIAKHKKIGLFDSKTKKVILFPNYDSITRFDDDHILLGCGFLRGLYSIPLRKIIVPVEYDGIAPIADGVAEVTKDSKKSHYDTHGNILS